MNPIQPQAKLPTFHSTKTFGHELGLSCCFRQHGATHSHCSLLHGYAIAVSLEFQATNLDEKNWVADFGGLKQVKQFLQETFDHKLLVAQDDPHLDQLTMLSGLDLAHVVVLPAVGCEAFAAYVGEKVQAMMVTQYGFRVRLTKCEVREHGANSAFVTYP